MTTDSLNPIPPETLERVAKAIWNWEHEGRTGQVLDIEWSLLRSDYLCRAQVAIAAYGGDTVQGDISPGEKASPHHAQPSEIPVNRELLLTAIYTDIEDCTLGSGHPVPTIAIEHAAQSVMGTIEPFLAKHKPVMSNCEITVGKYTLRDHKLKVGCITIMGEGGEGGTFDEAELEKVIGAFYAKYF